MLFEMLSGTRAFDGATTVEALSPRSWNASRTGHGCQPPCPLPCRGLIAPLSAEGSDQAPAARG